MHVARQAATVSLPFLLCFAALVAEPRGALGEAPPVPAVFRQLAGSWVGEGTLFGRPARFNMTWEIGPEGEIELQFTNGLVDEAGAVTPVLEAVATYRVGPDGQLVGRWTDNRPQEIEIVGEAGEAVVVSDWKAPTESGRTEYRLLPDGTVEVEDRVLVDGELRPFGQARYRRR